MKQKIKFWVDSLIIIGVFLLTTSSYMKADNPTINDSTEQVTDIEGNIYHTVTIGTQLWMVENLKVTRYRNGDLIPNVSDFTQWNNLSIGAYCNYDNLSTNGITYGHLYNWYAVSDNRNICPKGWHVPSDDDWTILINYLGGKNLAGGKMKEIGTSHWNKPNTGADNISGFSALPGGLRLDDGSFKIIGSAAPWWSATEFGATSAFALYLDSPSVEVTRNHFVKPAGFYVRCVNGEQVSSSKNSRDNTMCTTIKFGNQTWMAGNLNVNTFTNGDPIPIAETYDEWREAGLKGKPVCCYFNNDPTIGGKYGKLYNWYAVNDPRGLAPKGWHIPTDSEVIILKTYLEAAVNKIKQTGIVDTQSSDTLKTNATNISEFFTLYTGIRSAVGFFHNYEKSAGFWSSTGGSEGMAEKYSIDFDDKNVSLGPVSKRYGFAVLCIQN